MVKSVFYNSLSTLVPSTESSDTSTVGIEVPTQNAYSFANIAYVSLLHM